MPHDSLLALRVGADNERQATAVRVPLVAKYGCWHSPRGGRGEAARPGQGIKQPGHSSHCGTSHAAALLANTESLHYLLAYHVLAGKALLAKDVPSGTTALQMLNGANVSAVKAKKGWGNSVDSSCVAWRQLASADTARTRQSGPGAASPQLPCPSTHVAIAPQALDVAQATPLP